jgi:hypothetical protein
VIATGAPKPAAPSRKAPNEADHQHLQALVFGDRQDRGADDVELAGLDRDLVEEHRADDDPGDRPQAVDEAEAGRGQRLAQRHAVEQQRHAKRDGHGDRAGQPALHAQHGQGKEERDRQQRDQAGQPQVAGGVVQVLPGLHEGSRLGRDVLHRRRWVAVAVDYWSYQ